MTEFNFLNIRKKSILIAVATALLSIGSFYFAVHILLNDKYLQIDERQVQDTLQNAVNALSAEHDKLATTTKDHAVSGETYFFAKGLNDDGADRNISRFLKISDHDIDVLLFYDEQSKVIFSSITGQTRNTSVDADRILLELRSADGVIRKRSDLNGGHSIIFVDENILLLSSHSILKSNGAGPSAGILVMGRFLDADLLESIGKAVRADLSLAPYFPEKNIEGRESETDKLNEKLQIKVEPISDEVIKGSVVMRDHNGLPIAKLSAQLPRESFKLGEETMRTVVYLLAILGVVFGFTGWLITNYTIVSRVSKFSRLLESIDLSGRMNQKLPEDGNDEITIATKRVNGLIGRFETIIVDYRETRKALELSEREYRTLVENSTFGVFRAKAGGKILFVNDGFAKIFEYDKKTELLKVSFKDLVSNEDQLNIFLEKLGREGKLRAQEISAVTRNGRNITILISAVIDRDLIVGNILDISEDPLVLDRLNSSEERYKGIIESSMDCICNISFDGKFLTMNNAGCRLNELDDPMELIGGSSTAGILENREEAERAITTASMGGTVSLRYKSVNKKGREIWWDSKITPVYDHFGQITSVLRISRDISERLAMEDEVERARKIDAIGILAGGIAHDFNNILSAILGNISLAQKAARTHKDEKLAANLESARSASVRAKDLTNQLLTFSKGGAPIRRTGLIEDFLVESAKFITTGTGVKCEFAIANDLWPVEIDEGQINQVVNNLVINAVQSMESSGIVQISAINVTSFPEAELIKKAKRFVKISIADQGGGISPENLGKIFDPYFTTKTKGSGLGLSTCYSIIKNHDGVITVDSEEGKGATFNIYLPASSKKVNAVAGTDDNAGFDEIALNARVLIMDDEPSIIEVLTAVLEDMGCRVESAGSGDKALSIFQEAFGSDDPFVLVITDLTVPGGFGGKELLDHLKKLDPAVNVIVTSGYSASPIMSDYEKYGFSGVIPKPFDIDDIKEVVLGVLK